MSHATHPPPSAAALAQFCSLVLQHVNSADTRKPDIHARACCSRRWGKMSLLKLAIVLLMLTSIVILATFINYAVCVCLTVFVCACSQCAYVVVSFCHTPSLPTVCQLRATESDL